MTYQNCSFEDIEQKSKLVYYLNNDVSVNEKWMRNWWYVLTLKEYRLREIWEVERVRLEPRAWSESATQPIELTAQKAEEMNE